LDNHPVDFLLSTKLAILLNLFSRFHRGRNTSLYPGNGLGLAIVKAIADNHRAAIKVEGQLPGTTAIIFFQ